jgi:hypothetical protein
MGIGIMILGWKILISLIVILFAIMLVFYSIGLSYWNADPSWNHWRFWEWGRKQKVDWTYNPSGLVRWNRKLCKLETRDDPFDSWRDVYPDDPDLTKEFIKHMEKMDAIFGGVKGESS